jgi:hypothetical protein
VAPYSRPGVVRQVAVGLGRGGVDHLDRINPQRRADLRELVRQRQVHRTERVLMKFGQLGRLR